MQLYRFNEQTQEIFTDSLHNADWLDNITPSIPFNCIIANISLPTLEANQALIVVGERVDNLLTLSANSQIVNDYRGVKYYDLGGEHEITELGQIVPKNSSLTPPPSDFHRWNGKRWIEDKQAKQEQLTIEAETKKQALLTEIIPAITPLQDAVDLEMATDEEIVQLKAWKKYRVLLNRIDTSNASAITWPEKP